MYCNVLSKLYILLYNSEVIYISFEDFMESDLFPDFALGMGVGYCQKDNIPKGYQYLMNYVSQNNNEKINSDFVYNILKNKLKEYKNDKKFEQAVYVCECITKTIETDLWSNYDFWVDAAFCAKESNFSYLAFECYKRCLDFSGFDKDFYRIIGDILFFELDDKVKSIYYYEKYLEYIKDNPYVYNILGHIYETVYKSEHIDKQLEYFQKAVDLQPDEPSFRKNLGLVAGRNGKIKLFKENYETLLKLNHQNGDYFDYACWAFKNKCFDIAYKYFWYRFYKEVVPTPYKNLSFKLWDKNKDLRNKILCLKYEQGFGDTIMLSRFLPQFMQTAPNLIVQVQEPLIPLMQYNFPNIKFVSDKSEIIENNDYDYQFPMMELLPYLKITDKNMPLKDKYLDVDRKKTVEFAKKYINNNKKLKVGVAYHGHPDYLGDNRDVPIDLFADIATVPNIEVYNFQLTNKNDFLSNEKCKEVIDLSPYLSDFEQTALGMKNMDIIISTDNVVLNLAGSMGLKTYGLFNYYSDYRWFAINENDTGWYSSIEVYRAEKFDDWDNVMKNVIKNLSIIAKEKSVKQKSNK